MRGESYQMQGQQGGVVINAASGVVTRNIRYMVVLTDAVFATLVSNVTNTAAMIGPVIPSGREIGGQTKSVSLVSGVVIAYDA
jgi:di/tricarboxylate transporter